MDLFCSLRVIGSKLALSVMPEARFWVCVGDWGYNFVRTTVIRKTCYSSGYVLVLDHGLSNWVEIILETVMFYSNNLLLRFFTGYGGKPK